LTTEGKKLAQMALENNRKADALGEEIREINDKTRDEMHRIQYDVYQPKIRALEKESQEAVQQVEDTGNKAAAVKQVEIVELMRPVQEVKRILDFLRLDTKEDLNILDSEITYPDRQLHYYRENLGLIYTDKYLNIRLFILQNDKPTNKYQLDLVGRCLFPEGLLKLPHDYGISGTPYHASPQQILREAPRVQDLRDWWAAHGLSKLEWLNEYLKVKEEYEHILKTYKLEDFGDFVTQLCPKCMYFHTIFDNYARYRNEVIKCPRCETPMLDKQPAKDGVNAK
jgi:hypothetical protein